MRIDLVVHPVEKDGHKYLRIKSEVEICLFLSSTTAKIRKLNALWDTGATNTCISMDLAIAMGIPLGKETVIQLGTVNQPSRYCSFYLRFPDEHYILVKNGVAVPGSKNKLVIGMDLMRLGTTTITPNEQEGVCFNFEISETEFQNGVIQ